MYSTILRSSGQCDENTFQKNTKRSYGSNAEIREKVPRKKNIFKTRNISKRRLDDNDMTLQRDTTLIHRVKTFLVESRKKEFDEIVLNWNISVDESTLYPFLGLCHCHQDVF